ncbi:MAG: type II toxin-antitoxin system HicB family antitoxin [Candidatus Gracilibacteria bacterium]|nr:type II toxin-antitoxin system HicB family antitoxin [Candidatus Gracilibacteria bacterium]MDD3120174.1 type II toxin-antitoxin system HicB family antitoxin [Candidatus Gracilibacteria bacterium]MDD4530248.1 type II toxin-antitoxin system HicB family antitoxin [Candidatus Gracilibacteria bacterium]
MNKDVKKYINFDINYFQDEDGVFTATTPQINGCIASGKTLEEAYENMIDGIDSCIEARFIILDALNKKSKYQNINTYKRNTYA